MSERSEEKPKALVTVSRPTAQEETCQVTMYIDELSQEAIYNAVTLAGEALCQRILDCNKKFAHIKDPIPTFASPKGGSA